MRVRPGKVPMPPPPDKRNPLRPGPNVPMPPPADIRNPLRPPPTLQPPMAGKGLPAGAGAVPPTPIGKMKKGGAVKSSASKRADGCATKGKTRGRIV